jgi:hypothetical protein
MLLLCSRNKIGVLRWIQYSELIPAFVASCMPILGCRIGIKEKTRQYNEVWAKVANGVLCAYDWFFISIIYGAFSAVSPPIAHKMLILHKAINTQDTRNVKD